MATILASENIAQGKSAVVVYRTTCEGIYKSMSADISGLIGSGFVGDAANGYASFFEQITPALTTNLTGTENSVTSMLESLLTLVEQMLNPVDPELGQANTNAAGEGGN